MKYSYQSGNSQMTAITAVSIASIWDKNCSGLMGPYFILSEISEDCRFSCALMWDRSYQSEHRADSRLASSQWETALQSNAVSHWLGANLESALWTHGCTCAWLWSLDSGVDYGAVPDIPSCIFNVKCAQKTAMIDWQSDWWPWWHNQYEQVPTQVSFVVQPSWW